MQNSVTKIRIVEFKCRELVYIFAKDGINMCK